MIQKLAGGSTRIRQTTSMDLTFMLIATTTLLPMLITLDLLRKKIPALSMKAISMESMSLIATVKDIGIAKEEAPSQPIPRFMLDLA